ncbi:MAG: hypothetical protein CL878_05950 [Dehalococcoidia bacterium]|nr:hypothetical protein [Dehalococcoidia bacterium]
MLHCYPELVRQEKAVDCSPDLGSEFVDMIPTEYYTPSGAWGYPSKATTEQGKERTGQAVERPADYVMDAIERLVTMRAKPTPPGKRC